MIDVTCKDSPTGRHEWGFVVPYRDGAEKVFVVCKHPECRMVITKAQATRYLNAAMMLTADEAELFVRDGTLDPTHVFERYARASRGE